MIVSNLREFWKEIILAIVATALLSILLGVISVFIPIPETISNEFFIPINMLAIVAGGLFCGWLVSKKTKEIKPIIISAILSMLVFAIIYSMIVLVIDLSLFLAAPRETLDMSFVVMVDYEPLTDAELDAMWFMVLGLNILRPIQTILLYSALGSFGGLIAGLIATKGANK